VRRHRGFVEELKKALPKGFKPKGDLFVFVDECHRTQSGELHQAMKALLPGAVFIGFTGTPLLKADKKKSIEIFGRYIHTYKFDEAVPTAWCSICATRRATSTRASPRRPRSTSGSRPRPRGLTPLAKAQLKARWGTMQKVLSSQSRLKIVADILIDMETRAPARAARQRDAGRRQHLRGLQVLRALREDASRASAPS
jgi:type I restriction enzyme R subunit